MLCGGAEEIHYMVAVVFDVMRAASSRYNAVPEETPRPFDEERDGLVVGEGAGCLVLEEREHARRRGARIYAEVLGYGTNTDGRQMTTPDPDSMAAVLARALEDARLSADEIGYVNAHATATEVGDLAESIALHRVLGDRVPVSGLKGYMGHTLGASGAIESIATILMMKERFFAPTRNLVNPDPKCAPLNHVLHNPREGAVSVGMNNNFAFGGVNTSLIFGAV
jgi:3-oxoacyl-[acyl-carrier-protein] synthase II